MNSGGRYGGHGPPLYLNTFPQPKMRLSGWGQLAINSAPLILRDLNSADGDRIIKEVVSWWVSCIDRMLREYIQHNFLNMHKTYH